MDLRPMKIHTSKMKKIPMIVREREQKKEEVVDLRPKKKESSMRKTQAKTILKNLWPLRFKRVQDRQKKELDLRPLRLKPTR